MPTAHFNRRRSLGAVAIAAATTQFGAVSRAAAQATNADGFGPLKHVDAGLLNVGFVEVGPAAGPALILLHGWPYDIHSYAEVAPLLAAAGYRG